MLAAFKVNEESKMRVAHMHVIDILHSAGVEIVQAVSLSSIAVAVLVDTSGNIKMHVELKTKMLKNNDEKGVRVDGGE